MARVRGNRGVVKNVYCPANSLTIAFKRMGDKKSQFQHVTRSKLWGALSLPLSVGRNRSCSDIHKTMSCCCRGKSYYNALVFLMLLIGRLFVLAQRVSAVVKINVIRTRV